jgi:hypothetical protein
MNIIPLILVSYVICRVITKESGPFEIFEKFRLFLGRHANNSPVTRFVADVFNCPFCMGFWVSIIIASISGLGMIEALSIYGGQYFLERMGQYRGDE